MSTTPKHRCVRCGRPVQQPGQACLDCRSADPVAILMSRNAQAERERIASKAHRLIHRTHPSTQEATA